MPRTMTGLLVIGFGLQGCGAPPANSGAAEPAKVQTNGPAEPAMTASDATALANAEVARTLPGFDRSRRTIRADEADGKWRVMYESPDDLSAGGPVIVAVDPRTRRAAIVQMPN